jgi:signal transduction histidine kinase
MAAGSTSPQSLPWARVAALATLGAALGATALRGDGDARWFALGNAAVVAAVAAAWALIAAGLMTWWRRPGNRTGPLATAAGLASLAPALIGWGAGPSLLLTAALLLGGVAVPLALHAALAFPTGRLGSPLERAAIALAYLGGVLLWPALVVFTDPVDDGCFRCANNLVGFARDRSAVEQLAGWNAWLAIASCAAVGGLAARRLVTTPAARRTLVGPALAGGLALAVAVSLAGVHVVRDGFESFEPATGALFMARSGAFALIAGGLAWGLIRVRRTRAAVAALVADLGNAPAPETLRDELAHALRDPTLRLAYWLPERGEYVDAEGRVAELPAPGDDHAITQVRRGGERIAVLVHHPSVQQEAGLVEELADILRLGVEHERLRARIRAQLAQLSASRAHVVAVGDAERRRLERDLHDGAQQRLLSLGLALQLAQAPPGPGPEATAALVDARRELEAALTQLRELAHGIHPAILTEEGLAAALATLAQRARVPLVVDRLPAGRLPEPIEVTTYLLAAEAVAAATDGSDVSFAVTQEADRTIIDMEGRGVGPGVEPLEDRVAALDGRLVVAPAPGGRTHVHVELPGSGAPR